MKHRADIEALRALAIALVLVFHALPWALPGGFLGVDVFFVLSGYLITFLLVREQATSGRIALRSFVARRILRLGPALGVTMTATLAVGWFWLYPNDYAATGRTALAAAFGLANIEIGWSQNYFAPVVQNALTHTWSLGVEEQFYLVWPFVLAAFARARLFWWLVLAVLVSVVGFAWATMAQRLDAAWAFFRPDARAWEMSAGAALAIAHNVWKKSAEDEENSASWAGSAFFVACILFILFLCFSWRAAFPHPGWGTLPVVLATLAALHVGRSVSFPTTGAAWAVLVAKCGALSYALYLVHWPIFVVWRSITSAPFTVAEALGAIVLSVVFAWALHRWVETPLRHPKPQYVKPAILATLLLMFGVAVAGATVFVKRGVPDRIAPEIRALGWYDSDLLNQARKCHFYFRTGESPSDVSECLQGYAEGVAAAPSWAIWGDSHATSLIAGMMANRATPPFLGFGASGCPPVVRQTTQGHRQCHLFGERVLDLLESNPSVRVVVLHARWSWYPFHNNRNQIVDAAGHSVVRPFFEEIDHTIALLQERGYRVVIVGPVPEQDVSVPQTVMRRTWYEDRIPDVEISRDAYERRHAASLRWLSGWEERGIPVVWPGRILCDAARCRAVDRRGQVLFFDEHHLSVEGAYLLSSPLISKKDGLLEGSDRATGH